MSNGHKLELSRWGNDEIYLAFWDVMRGEDVLYKLDADSKAAWKCNDDCEPVELVNLSESLRGLLKELEGRDE